MSPRLTHDDPRYRAALNEMGRRLTVLLNERNWNQADFVRAAAKHMPNDNRFGPDNASNFVNGRRKPTRPFLIAMCKALNVEEKDILPDLLLKGPGEHVPATPALLSDVLGKPGIVRLYVDRELPLKEALTILRALDAIGSGDGAPSNP